jgi:hypothetical protein
LWTRPEKLQAAEFDFRPGSADDFPVMIEENDGRPGLLIEEHDISSSVGLEHVSTHCPVTNSERLYCVASSGTPYRHGIVAGAGTRRNSRALEFFLCRGCVLYERGKIGNITRSNVQRRIFVWMEK